MQEVKDFSLPAVLLVLLGNLSWVVAFIYPNENEIRFFESSLVRGYVLLMASYFLCLRKKVDTTLKDKSSFGRLMLRNVIMSMNGWVAGFAQFYLPISIVHTLSAGGPIFIFLIDYYLNGVGVSKKQVVGIALGVVGLVLTVNGSFIMVLLDPQYKIETEFQNYRTESFFVMFLVSLMVVAMSALWGYGIVMVKSLVAYSAFQIAYHLGILMVGFSSLWYCLLGENTFSFQEFWWCVLLTGVPSTVTTLTYISANKMMKNTGILMIVTFSTVAFGYFFSIFYYSETQNPICIAGVFFIFFGVTAAIVLKNPS